MDNKIPGANLTTTTLPVKGLRTKENISLVVELRGVEFFLFFCLLGLDGGRLVQVCSGVFLDALNSFQTV